MSEFKELENTEKKHLGLVVCGHVDAGKSTSTGRLLFECGGVSEREMEKLKKKAIENGKESFAFAYYLDNNKEERERGITITCNTKEFFTKQWHYSIVDAPGHKDYINNFISGSSQTDAMLLLVPAEVGGFEAAIARGDQKTGLGQGQTRQHARLCKLSGIEQVIVGVNKMDSVDWSEERFNEIKAEITEMLKQVGYKPAKIPIIPYSGFNGDNLTSVSNKAPWYKGFDVVINKKEGIRAKGHTILDALDTVIRPPVRDENAPMRMPVSSIYSIKGVGDVICGKIEQGRVDAGSEVVFMPSGVSGKVFSIEMHHKSHPNAGPGDNVGLNIKGLSKDNMPKRGDIMMLKSESRTRVASFTAQIFVQEHPGELKTGFAPSIFIRTSKTPCVMREIAWKSHPKRTNGEKMMEPPFVQSGDSAYVTFEPKLPMYCETFEECEGLGRVAVMDSNQLVMMGKIMEVTYV